MQPATELSKQQIERWRELVLSNSSADHLLFASSVVQQRHALMADLTQLQTARERAERANKEVTTLVKEISVLTQKVNDLEEQVQTRDNELAWLRKENNRYESESLLSRHVKNASEIEVRSFTRKISEQEERIKNLRQLLGAQLEDLFNKLNTRAVHEQGK